MSRVTKYKSSLNTDIVKSPLVLPNEYSSIIDEAWLDLGDTSKLQLENPFDKYTDEDIGLRLMKIWSDPNYFAYTCKVLLNINLLPEQAAILKILWEHAFPMFVASRGFGKCTCRSTLITSQEGTHPLSNILPPHMIPHTKYPINGLKLLGENGYKGVEYVWSNGLSPTITIITNTCRKLTGTHNHPIRAYQDDSVIWKELQNIELGDIVPIYGHDPEYIREIRYGQEETFDVYIPDDHSFITNGFISHNSFLLGVYATLRCLLIPKTKVVICGSAYRQSKIIFEYMENIWQNAPMMRDICTQNSGPRRDIDRCVMYLNDSMATAIPIGSGEKIRGLRANVIIMDEFSATSPEIYETVISGFAAVSADPLINVKLAAGRRKKKELGLTDGVDTSRVDGKKFNQSILSGTADYSFKHFAKYWDRYRKIVNSNGQHDQMKELFTDGVIPRNFDYRDYAIVRFPYELVPEGFMDDAIVTRARATMNSSTYNLEYGTIFVDDSDGFFKRSLIDSCVGTDINPIKLPSGDVYFDAKVYGMKDYNYVFAVDPASEVDNFSVVILELHVDHTRVVYCWTTNRERHKKYVKDGLTKEHDFYGFCSRKIRNLMKVFPCIKIAMDAQGGGRAIEESLHDPDKLELGELPIWTIEDPAKPAYGDGQPGLHILEMVQFRKTDWVMEANHGMKKDLEDKVLLFPRFDALTLEMAMVQDNTRVGTVYDTLEDCCLEIEELKNELCTIVHSTTGPGVGAVDRWDTPETKQPNGKKGRMRKDRYSALLMANMAARQMMRVPPPISYGAIGGFTRDIYTTEKGPLYTGPAWFTEGGDDGYFGVVRH